MKPLLLVLMLVQLSACSDAEVTNCEDSFFSKTEGYESQTAIIQRGVQDDLLIFNPGCPERMYPVEISSGVREQVISAMRATPPHIWQDMQFYAAEIEFAAAVDDGETEFHIKRIEDVRQLRSPPVWMK